MQTQQSIRNTEIEFPDRDGDELPAGTTADDGDGGDGDGAQETENGEQDVEVRVAVGQEWPPGVALEGEEGDGVVGEEVGEEADGAVGEAVALDFGGEGAVSGGWGGEPGCEGCCGGWLGREDGYDEG